MSAEKEKHEASEAVLARSIKSMEGKRVEIKARATEKGGLFKSINAADIRKVLDIDIPEDVIRVSRPIKETGEHTVELCIPGAKATLSVMVVAS